MQGRFAKEQQHFGGLTNYYIAQREAKKDRNFCLCGFFLTDNNKNLVHPRFPY